MTAPLSLVPIARGALQVAPQVPAALRARASIQLSAAVRRGQITAAELGQAVAAGDAGVGELMMRHHVLRADLELPRKGLARSWSPDAATLSALTDWAASLRAAGRLDDSQLVRIAQANAFQGLLAACARAAVPAGGMPSLPALTTPAATHQLLSVCSNYCEAVVGSASLPQSAAAIRIEPLVLPLVELPRLGPEDRLALLSAIAAVEDADPFGLIITPPQLPHVMDGWFIESLRDIHVQARKDEHGNLVLSDAHLETLEQEFGLEFDDRDEAGKLIAAHLGYLDNLRVKPWGASSARMRKWLAGNTGRAIAAVVRRLLACAVQLAGIDAQRDTFEREDDGDPTAIMFIEPPPAECHLFFGQLESYGSNDQPAITLTFHDAQDATAFWSLHDAVVIAASLITDAAHAIQSLQQESAEQLGRAA